MDSEAYSEASPSSEDLRMSIHDKSKLDFICIKGLKG